MKNILTMLAAVLLALPASVSAGDNENQLIDKVIQAYGGDALVNMKNYQLSANYFLPSTGQSRDPALLEINKSSQALIVDLENNKASFDNWFVGRGGGFQGSTISHGVGSDDAKAYNLNFQSGNFEPANNADPYIFAGGAMRTSDTLLAFELNKVRDNASLGEDEDYLNRPHHVITIPFPSSPDLKLYVDAKTFLISRMLRVHPQFGNLDYVYSEYKDHNGIRYASISNFFVDGAPNSIGRGREMNFNESLSDDVFALPSDLKVEEQRIDVSKPIVNKLSNRAYHVGQGNGYSLFADTSAGVVGVGGYPGVDTRFRQYQVEADNHRPLAYQVITHHHSDHLGGLNDALNLGARLITVSENMDEIKDNVDPSPKKRDFLAVGAKTTLGDGKNRVEIYEVSTIHSASFLVTYLPAERTVFIADHMGSPFANKAPIAGQGTVDMFHALQALNIPISKIVTAHNARIFTMQEMRDSVAGYKANTCLGNRPVCQ